MKLQGKVAVVTGGLRGIGHAIAVALAQEGADLLIAGLSMDRAAHIEQEIRTLGRRCVVVPADVADERRSKP
jgi:NAD(P)-dependent dehydrogenase (short-subunit alcohol dehydrogenase family)